MKLWSDIVQLYEIKTIRIYYKISFYSIEILKAFGESKTQVIL